MKVATAVLSTAMAIFMAVGSAHARGLKTCEAEIKGINQFLASNGMEPIKNIAELASTLRQIERTGRLPPMYITASEASRLGWSGKDSETLWGLKPTNKKWIGGDAYRSKSLPANVQWLSADVDVVRGYRSNKRLIYSLRSRQRFISPDRYQHFVELEPCK